MSNEETKPRIYYIIFEKGFSPWVADKPLNSNYATEELKVIEYSAYESAIEERGSANTFIKQLTLHNVDQADKIDQLTKDLKIVRTAMEGQCALNDALTEKNNKLVECVKAIAAEYPQFGDALTYPELSRETLKAAGVEV